MTKVDVTPYEVLGVDETASADEIKIAYRKMVRQAHPDTGGNSTLFRLVQEAWDILGDKTKRKSYDNNLNIPPANRYMAYPSPPEWYNSNYTSGQAEAGVEEAYDKGDKNSYFTGNSWFSEATGTTGLISSAKSKNKPQKRSWIQTGFNLRRQEDKTESLVYYAWWGSAIILAVIGYVGGAIALWSEWNPGNSNMVAGFFALLIALVPGIFYGIVGYGIGFVLGLLVRGGFFLYKLKYYLKS